MDESCSRQRPANENHTDTHDGRNQVTGSGGTTVAHDARGNTTSDGTRSFSYDSQNRMRTGTVGGTATTLFYDPLGRISQANEPSGRWYANDGAATVYESNGTATPTNRRWVYGADATEPLVEYQGPSTSDRRYLHADERGSVIAMSDSAGTVTAVNRYDEYGAPASTNQGRFQYTGQAWLPTLGLYYYRARMYNPSGPAGGRFMQPDPIGYGDGPNLYAYVSGDPVNRVDPTGTEQLCGNVSNQDGYTYMDGPEPVVVSSTYTEQCFEIRRPTRYFGSPGGGGGGGGGTGDPDNSLLCSLAVADAQAGLSMSPLAASNTPTERNMVARYFRGVGGTFTLPPAERAAALAYIQANIGHRGIVQRPFLGMLSGYNSRYVNFAYWNPLAGYSGEPLLDGLLGSARVDFYRDEPLRLSDVYDFNEGNRSWPVEVAVAYVRGSAATFCANPTPIPVRSEF